MLIIAGPPEKRRPFEATRLTIKVEALEQALDVLAKTGATQMEPIQKRLPSAAKPASATLTG